MKKICIVDNNDSFVYNIYHAIKKVCPSSIVNVILNKNVNLALLHSYNGVVLSPGPALPSEDKYLLNITHYIIENKIPCLGVCLGHQALAYCLGAKLMHLSCPLHGHRSSLTIIDNNDSLLYNLTSINTIVGHYHSWIVNKEGIPNSIKISSIDDKGIIMSFYSALYPIHGVQFHPESYISNCADTIFTNWLNTI